MPQNTPVSETFYVNSPEFRAVTIDKKGYIISGITFKGEYIASGVNIKKLQETIDEYINNTVVSVDNYLQNRLLAPSYQFGIGIDCNYEVPEVPALVLPPEGQRCAYFYSLYDSLMAQYQNYITKVDCDAECVAAGIERPDYMNDYPIYMYKFIPPYTPNYVEYERKATDKSRLKVYIVTGTHREYMAIWDMYQTMKLICESWSSDANLDALRWEAEYYIIPCSGPYGIEHNSRTNYNGVDLNRNAPTKVWVKTEEGRTYSGPYPGSEYETKVFVHYMDTIKPQIFIDHHNSNEGDGKNLIYVSSVQQSEVDIAATHISAMTRRWKKRYDEIFPSDDIIYGFCYKSSYRGGYRGIYGYEKGALSCTYESNRSRVYHDGQYDPEHFISYDAVTCTIATDGILNFLLRLLKTYSELH